MNHETKHTPGPWSWSVVDNAIMAKQSHTPFKFNVAWVNEELAAVPDNKALIAAAPDLFHALENLHGELCLAFEDVPAGVDAWMSKARQAIAKAKGQP